MEKFINSFCYLVRHGQEPFKQCTPDRRGYRAPAAESRIFAAHYFSLPKQVRVLAIKLSKLREWWVTRGRE